MKYVRHETKGFFLFSKSDNVWHMHVGDFLGYDGLVSAGFVMFKEGVPECYGYSDSLELGGAEDDTVELRRQMGFKDTV